MHQLIYEHHQSIPVIKCSLCGICQSVETENSFGINRGCCFYFPVYTLTDIRRLAEQDPDFLTFLRALPDTVMHDYSLVVTGDVDRDGMMQALKNKEDQPMPSGSEKVFDPILQYRKCRFITEQGCSIRFDQRPHPCNLYLCRSVIERAKTAYRPYARERKDYFAYVRYTDRVLEDALKERGLSLQADFDEAVKGLLETPVDTFEFDELEPIGFDAG